MSDNTIVPADRAFDVREEYEQIYEQPDPRAYFRILHGLDYSHPRTCKSGFPQCRRPACRSEIRSSAHSRGRLRLRDQRGPVALSDGHGPARPFAAVTSTTGELGSRPGDGTRPELFCILAHACSMSTISVSMSRRSRSPTRSPCVSSTMASRAISRPKNWTGEEAALLHNVDLVISTGCVGYISQSTFDRMFAQMKGPLPWLAIFVLRTRTFRPIECIL